jgi:hypothetical protein
MKILHWEILGIIFIICVGSVLHFVFELSGFWKPVGLIAAVNESVWEHLKLGFWPAVFFALIEYPFLKETENFVIAKAVSIYLIPFGIAALFYSYTFILGYNTLAMDVLIFVFAVVIGQVASYKILTASELPQKLNVTAFLAVVVLAVLFMVFTFYPPHVSLFEDTVTGGYGIPQ